MNLNLILENIRLKHIEALLQEDATDLEVVRGQRLINESIMQLRGVLMEEASIQEIKNSTRRSVKPDNLRGAAAAIGAGGLVGAASGAAGGAALNGKLDNDSPASNEVLLGASDGGVLGMSDTDGLAGEGALLGAGLGVAVPLTQLLAGKATQEQGKLQGLNNARALRSINRNRNFNYNI